MYVCVLLILQGEIAEPDFRQSLKRLSFLSKLRSCCQTMAYDS